MCNQGPANRRISTYSKEKKAEHPPRDGPRRESKRTDTQETTTINANATSEGELCFDVRCLTIRSFPPLLALARAQLHTLQHPLQILHLPQTLCIDRVHLGSHFPALSHPHWHLPIPLQKKPQTLVHSPPSFLAPLV